MKKGDAAGEGVSAERLKELQELFPTAHDIGALILLNAEYYIHAKFGVLSLDDMMNRPFPISDIEIQALNIGYYAKDDVKGSALLANYAALQALVSNVAFTRHRAQMEEFFKVAYRIYYYLHGMLMAIVPLTALSKKGMQEISAVDGYIDGLKFMEERLGLQLYSDVNFLDMLIGAIARNEKDVKVLADISGLNLDCAMTGLEEVKSEAAAVCIMAKELAGLIPKYNAQKYKPIEISDRALSAVKHVSEWRYMQSAQFEDDDFRQEVTRKFSSIKKGGRKCLKKARTLLSEQVEA